MRRVPAGSSARVALAVQTSDQVVVGDAVLAAGGVVVVLQCDLGQAAAKSGGRSCVHIHLTVVVSTRRLSGMKVILSHTKKLVNNFVKYVGY